MKIRTDINLENPEPGIYTGVTFDEYVSINAVNNSVLKIFTDQSPAHAKYYMDNGRPETAALSFGTLADCYILENDTFFDNYIVGPDARGNSNEWKDFVKANPDKTVIKQKDLDAAISIYNQISSSSGFRLLSGGVSQIVLVWIDEKTGLKCKARLDYVNFDQSIITDLKTTRSANPADFSRDIAKFKYHQQAGFYMDGFKHLAGEDGAIWCFFACEKVEPYVSSCFQLGERSVEAGRVQYRIALDAYSKCVEKNEWPPYCTTAQMIDIPQWALEAAGVGTHNVTNWGY
jgi:exodeoxyribonuclease VIII